ncbi:hypothetical protein F5878DRAFT_22479 [Lentinula raphanica]|uniref:Uncharacterized protein n=1 Tax=Lentinula raphanica TaxID=153919 RepID=A0AA38UGT6_9AGAR|nr:hypothetical protein F5878DRAFT_22479 [Lentinula raphanica]
MFVTILKKRVDVCARVCIKAVSNPSSVAIEDLGVSAESDCLIADAEYLFLRLSQSSRHSPPETFPQTSVSEDGSSSIINKGTLYNPSLFVFFHCPLIAILCFIKFSMIPLFLSTPANESSTPPSGAVLFGVIFGVISTSALLAVAIVWSLFAYHLLPHVEDIWAAFLLDLEVSHCQASVTP